MAHEILKCISSSSITIVLGLVVLSVSLKLGKDEVENSTKGDNDKSNTTTAQFKSKYKLLNSSEQFDTTTTDYEFVTFADDVTASTTADTNNVKYDESDKDHQIDLITTTKESVEKENTKLCSFMHVSHNASYAIYDREEFSKGLDYIHSTSDIFEKFESIDIEEGCEATICRLDLLNQDGRKRTCFSLNKSQSFETERSEQAIDPITRQYFVSTGCSCKVPEPGCLSSTSKCNTIEKLKENECAILFKEHSCLECRYNRMILRHQESFYPSNGFWCQSYVVRNGCRLSIDMTNSTGQFNIRNYTDSDSNVAMDYVRYPNPSKLSCLCDVSMRKMKNENLYWIIGASIGIPIILLMSITVYISQKCCSIRLEPKISKNQLDDLILKFKEGFSKSAETSHENDTSNKYVSVGYLKAIEQPYQHKWEIKRGSVIIDTKEKPLGSGMFGSVHIGILKTQLQKETPVAIKIAKADNLPLALDEIKILSYVGKHANICGMLGACTAGIPEKEALIILELCSEGNLRNYLLNNKSQFTSSPIPATANVDYVTLDNLGYASMESLNNPIPESNYFNSRIKPDCSQLLINFAKQIACGMEFLGLKQVIHADLAARNILLTDTLDCKIADFGLSQRFHEEVVNYVRIGSEYPLPFRWMALESLTNLKFTVHSDCWSFGIVLFEIFSLGEEPYSNFHLHDLIINLKNGRRISKPIFCPDNIYEIMTQCWDIDMSKRPSFRQLKFLFEEMQSL